MGVLDRILTTLGLRSEAPADEPGPGESASDSGDASAETDAGASEDAEEDDLTPTDEGERDPELEAIDDPGSFEFRQDIARYFTAEFRIEQGWKNPQRRATLFGEYAVRDTAHWFQIQATFARWLESDEGRQSYPTPSSLMQARMTTTQTVSVEELDLLIAEARAAKSES